MAPLRRNRADPANAQSPRGSGGPAPAREAGVADPGTIDALAGVRGAGGDDRAADGRSGAPAIPGGIGGDDPDQTALHTGMLLAWTLLGGRSAQPAVLRCPARGAAARSRGGRRRPGSPRHRRRSAGVAAHRSRRADGVRAHSRHPGARRGARAGVGPRRPRRTAAARRGLARWAARGLPGGGAGQERPAAQQLLQKPDHARFFLDHIQVAEPGPARQATAAALTELETLGKQPQVGLDGAARVTEITARLH